MFNEGMYRAIVTSIADPTGQRKIKVQCPQISGTAELNWAEPLFYSDPLPDPGSIVWIFFSGGDTTKPVYAITAFPKVYGKWQTPSLKTNWSFNTVFGGLGGPPLKFRKTREDEVMFYGNFKASTGAGTTVFTLPSYFYNPNADGMSGYVLRNSGGVINTYSAAVNVTTGDVIIGITPSNGDEFHFNVRMPMKFLIT